MQNTTSTTKKLRCRCCFQLRAPHLLTDHPMGQQIGLPKKSMCLQCLAIYKAGRWAWKLNDEGKDEFCRICGEGNLGTVSCDSDDCTFSFCEGCVLGNCGRSNYDKILELAEGSLWLCFVCTLKKTQKLATSTTKNTHNRIRRYLALSARASLGGFTKRTIFDPFELIKRHVPNMTYFHPPSLETYSEYDPEVDEDEDGDITSMIDPTAFLNEEDDDESNQNGLISYHPELAPAASTGSTYTPTTIPIPSSSSSSSSSPACASSSAPTAEPLPPPLPLPPPPRRPRKLLSFTFFLHELHVASHHTPYVYGLLENIRRIYHDGWFHDGWTMRIYYDESFLLPNPQDTFGNSYIPQEGIVCKMGYHQALRQVWYTTLYPIFEQFQQCGLLELRHFNWTHLQDKDHVHHGSIGCFARFLALGELGFGKRCYERIVMVDVDNHLTPRAKVYAENMTHQSQRFHDPRYTVPLWAGGFGVRVPTDEELLKSGVKSRLDWKNPYTNIERELHHWCVQHCRDPCEILKRPEMFHSSNSISSTSSSANDIDPTGSGHHCSLSEFPGPSQEGYRMRRDKRRQEEEEIRQNERREGEQIAAAPSDASPSPSSPHIKRDPIPSSSPSSPPVSPSSPSSASSSSSSRRSSGRSRTPTNPSDSTRTPPPPPARRTEEHKEAMRPSTNESPRRIDLKSTPPRPETIPSASTPSDVIVINSDDDDCVEISPPPPSSSKPVSNVKKRNTKTSSSGSKKVGGKGLRMKTKRSTTMTTTTTTTSTTPTTTIVTQTIVRESDGNEDGPTSEDNPTGSTLVDVELTIDPDGAMLEFFPYGSDQVFLADVVWPIMQRQPGGVETVWALLPSAQLSRTQKVWPPVLTPEQTKRLLTAPKYWSFMDWMENRLCPTPNQIETFVRTFITTKWSIMLQHFQVGPFSQRKRPYLSLMKNETVYASSSPQLKEDDDADNKNDDLIKFVKPFQPFQDGTTLEQHMKESKKRTERIANMIEQDQKLSLVQKDYRMKLEQTDKPSSTTKTTLTATKRVRRNTNESESTPTKRLNDPSSNHTTKRKLNLNQRGGGTGGGVTRESPSTSNPTPPTIRSTRTSRLSNRQPSTIQESNREEDDDDNDSDAMDVDSPSGAHTGIVDYGESDDDDDDNIDADSNSDAMEVDEDTSPPTPVMTTVPASKKRTLTTSLLTDSSQSARKRPKRNDHEEHKSNVKGETTTATTTSRNTKSTSKVSSSSEVLAGASSNVPSIYAHFLDECEWGCQSIHDARECQGVDEDEDDDSNGKVIADPSHTVPSSQQQRRSSTCVNKMKYNLVAEPNFKRVTRSSIKRLQNMDEDTKIDQTTAMTTTTAPTTSTVDLIDLDPDDSNEAPIQAVPSRPSRTKKAPKPLGEFIVDGDTIGGGGAGGGGSIGASTIVPKQRQSCECRCEFCYPTYFDVSSSSRSSSSSSSSRRSAPLRPLFHPSFPSSPWPWSLDIISSWLCSISTESFLPLASYLPEAKLSIGIRGGGGNKSSSQQGYEDMSQLVNTHPLNLLKLLNKSKYLFGGSQVFTQLLTWSLFQKLQQLKSEVREIAERQVKQQQQQQQQTSTNENDVTIIHA